MNELWKGLAITAAWGTFALVYFKAEPGQDLTALLIAVTLVTIYIASQ